MQIMKHQPRRTQAEARRRLRSGPCLLCSLEPSHSSSAVSCMCSVNRACAALISRVRSADVLSLSVGPSTSLSEKLMEDDVSSSSLFLWSLSSSSSSSSSTSSSTSAVLVRVLPPLGDPVESVSESLSSSASIALEILDIDSRISLGDGRVRCTNPGPRGVLTGVKAFR